MPYATFNDVFLRFPAIKTMIGSGQSDVATLDVASVYVYDAEGVVNAYLASQYNIPLNNDPLVTKLTCDLAIYELGVDRMPRIPEWMQNRYDRAIKTLEALRDSKMLLNPASQSTKSDGDNEAWSSTGSYHPIFSPVLRDVDQIEDKTYVSNEQDVRNFDSGSLS